MPANDPITTSRLAAAIREGMAAQPLLTDRARPVADRLAVLIGRRLPSVTPADTGELMIHLGAFLSDVMTVLTRQGETTDSAVLIATSAIAMAGVELHASENTPAATAEHVRRTHAHRAEDGYATLDYDDDQILAVLDNREQWRNLAYRRTAERDILAARVAELEGGRVPDVPGPEAEREADDVGDVPCFWCHCDGCDGCTGIHGVVCGCQNAVQR